MNLNLKTSNLIGALLRGALTGIALLILFWALQLPFDLKFGAILFAVGTIVGAISCYEHAPRLAPTQPGAEMLMGRVSWCFTTPAPEQLDQFVDLVTSQQSDPANWTPHEPIDDGGAITIEFHPYWDEVAAIPTRLTLEQPVDTRWTHGTLLYALHRTMRTSVDLGDHVYFEGLARIGKGAYRLYLGS